MTARSEVNGRQVEYDGSQWVYSDTREPAPSCCELPKYKCHKKVRALKIAKIDFHTLTDGGALIIPADGGYGPIEVDREYVRKHMPQSGGYYVVYGDGYKSFSPGSVFEDGYTRI